MSSSPRPIKPVAPEPLCEYCRRIPREDPSGEDPSWEDSPWGSPDTVEEAAGEREKTRSWKFEHYKSFESLDQSAEEGCKVCHILWLNLVEIGPVRHISELKEFKIIRDDADTHRNALFADNHCIVIRSRLRDETLSTIKLPITRQLQTIIPPSLKITKGVKSTAITPVLNGSCQC